MDLNTMIHFAQVVGKAYEIPPEQLNNSAGRVLTVTFGGTATSYGVITTVYANDLATDINRQRADNRIANLRPATRSQNQGNTISWRTNTSGYRGVRRTRYGRWKATISKNCCLIHLGTFDTPEEAHAAYCAEAKSFWGEFAREG